MNELIAKQETDIRDLMRRLALEQGKGAAVVQDLASLIEKSRSLYNAVCLASGGADIAAQVISQSYM